MKPEYKKTSGIVISCVSFAAIVLITLICVSLIFSIKDITSEQIGTVVIFLCLFDIILLIVGITSLTKGLKGYKSMKKGRKRECKIISLENSKQNTWYKELIVSYRGESGEKYEHVVPIFFAATHKLRVGQTIECYVLGDSCYIDTETPIKVLKEPEEELELE